MLTWAFVSFLKAVLKDGRAIELEGFGSLFFLTVMGDVAIVGLVAIVLWD